MSCYNTSIQVCRALPSPIAAIKKKSVSCGCGVYRSPKDWRGQPCSMHCRLAKFRGLMYQGKYGAVTGFKKPIAWKLLLGTYKNFGIFLLKQ